MKNTTIKKVVFVAGTAFSGSTMFDMMLGNTESAFSMGEVRFLFKPTKIFHINPPCGCGDRNCDIWPNLKKCGADRFYKGLFERFKNIKTIVDSSKDLFWIKEQRDNLKKYKIDSKIILIYKTPLEFALSRFKRNSLDGWELAWIRYHKLLITLFDDWCAVRYRDLAVHPSTTLERICSRFQLEFNDGMKNYWEKKHHLLFGNLSAKYHTLEKKDESYQKTVNHLGGIEKAVDLKKANIDASYRSIKYSVADQQVLPQSAIANAEMQKFVDLMRYIESKDVAADKPEILPNLKKNCSYPPAVVSLFFLKRLLLNRFFSFKYRKENSNLLFSFVAH